MIFDTLDGRIASLTRPRGLWQGVRQPRRHGRLRSRPGDRHLPVGRGAHHGVRQHWGRFGWLACFSTRSPPRCAWRASTRAPPAPTSATSRACRVPSAAAIVAAFIWFCSDWREPRLTGLIAAFAVTAMRRRPHGQQLQLPELQAVESRPAHPLCLHGAGAGHLRLIAVDPPRMLLAMFGTYALSAPALWIGRRCGA